MSTATLRSDLVAGSENIQSDVNFLKQRDDSAVHVTAYRQRVCHSFVA